MWTGRKKGRIDMSKQLILLALLAIPVAAPPSIRATQSAQPLLCLHGSSEQPNGRTRREQALRIADQINRSEAAAVGFSRNPVYRPLEGFGGVPVAPAGFRLQFYTDGATYAFSLKDTLDPCRYTIFSDQDQAIYQAVAEPAAKVTPAVVP
jgi:hypothetical protein